MLLISKIGVLFYFHFLNRTYLPVFQKLCKIDSDTQKRTGESEVSGGAGGGVWSRRKTRVQGRVRVREKGREKSNRINKSRQSP